MWSNLEAHCDGFATCCRKLYFSPANRQRLGNPTL